MGVPLNNMGVPLQNFVKIKAPSPMNSIIFYSTLEEILSFYNLPLKNSMVPQQGVGVVTGMKRNSLLQWPLL